jgi:hypothetical protein
MDFDVVIIGFGTSGFFLAFELIKNNLKVAVIEKEDNIGGALINSLIFPTAGFHTLSGKLIIVDSVKEFLDFCIKNGFSKGHIRDPLNFSYSITPINPIAYKAFFVDYFLPNNNFVLFSSSVIENVYEKDGIIRYVVIRNKDNKKYKIRGKFFVDASGVLELSNYIDIKYRLELENLQAATLIFRLSNIDFTKIIKYIKENKNDFYSKTDVDLMLSNDFISVSGYFELASKYLFNRDLLLSRDRFLFFGDILKNFVYVNTSRIFLKDVINFILNDVNNLGVKKEDFFKKCSSVILPSNKNFYKNKNILHYDILERMGYYLGLKQMFYIHKIMKKYIKGFENSYIDLIAYKLGIRQYKVLKGEYELNIEDVINCNNFDDKILIGTWPIDIHIKDKIVEKKVNEDGYYIPFRSLITKQYKNLIFVGKHISSDDYAFSSLRIQATCMNMGSLVGKILSNLLKKRSYVLDIDFSLIKKIFNQTFLTFY